MFGGVSTVRINTNVVGKEAVGRNSLRPRLFGRSRWGRARKGKKKHKGKHKGSRRGWSQ